MKPSSTSRPKVVVVGGSFSGLCCLRHLKKYDFDVTLVEPKEYFEYTPGVLHLLTGSKGDLISPLVPLATASGASRVLHGKFIGYDANTKNVAVKVTSGETENEVLLPYDAAIICTGVPYAAPIRQDMSLQKEGTTMADRLLQIDNYMDRLSNSSHIIISGGGLVGVELVAELSVRLQKHIKEVTLISRSNLLTTLPAPAGRYALSWLKNRKNVKLFIEDEIVSCDCPADQADGGVYVTKSGRQLRADMYIDCTGVNMKIPSTSSSSSSSSAPPSVPPISTKYRGGLLSPFNSKGLISVDEHFRVMDDSSSPSQTTASSIFAVGDVLEHSTGGGVGFAATTPMVPYGKLMMRSTVRNAHLAESQAEVCAHNVATILTSSSQGQGKGLHRLAKYPQDVFGAHLCPLLSCVSLGPYHGIIVFNDLVLGGVMFGLVGAFAKYAVERTKVAEIRNRLWARAFWAFAHVVVNNIHALYVAIKKITFKPWQKFQSFLRRDTTTGTKSVPPTVRSPGLI